jgi:hypothetical protein
MHLSPPVLGSALAVQHADAPRKTSGDYLECALSLVQQSTEVFHLVLLILELRRAGRMFIRHFKTPLGLLNGAVAVTSSWWV